MKRTKFTVVGAHPLLYLIRDHLILAGYQLVSEDEEADFCIFGAGFLERDPALSLVQLSSLEYYRDIPTLILSTGDVYCDRDSDLLVSEDKPMAEDRASVIPSSLDPNAPKMLFPLLVENLFLHNKSHVLILRIFDVYGPEIASGLISEFIRQAKNREELCVDAPGYQTRSFLHTEDFFSCIDKVIPKMLKGARGIYNLGASEEISLKRLADSVWQLTNEAVGGTPIRLVPAMTRQIWWKQPDITRIKALVNWKPKLTLRKGLWRVINDS